MDILIAKNIKQLRMEKGITQEQLAEAMNVSCAAVSKWERGETYPDITMLQPLAYYFGVTLDTLMGYDEEKIRRDIAEALGRYCRLRGRDLTQAREVIVKAHHDYPNDYLTMHYYMWNIAGDMADNDPAVLLAHKEEFLTLCDKILEGCTEEWLRLSAWNMRAKILHAEGQTEEALKIYYSKFADWYTTTGQKCEQLFAKDTPEYYEHVRHNMYELISFAGDKLGSVVFFDPDLTMEEKTEKALRCGKILLSAAEETGEAFFAALAKTFLGRMRNNLTHRGGNEEQIDAVSEPYQRAKAITDAVKITPIKIP